MPEPQKVKLSAAASIAKAAVKLRLEQVKIKEKWAKLRVLKDGVKKDAGLTALANKVEEALEDYSDAVDECCKMVRKFPLLKANKRECQDFMRRFAKYLAVVKKSHGKYRDAKRAVRYALDESGNPDVLDRLYVWLLDDHQILKPLAGIRDNVADVAGALK
jgi:hypothetical protein